MRGLLLAGGASHRMGRDKAMLQIEGIPLWRRQVSKLQNVCEGIVAVAAPQRPVWLPDDLPWVQDCGAQGPLGGILAGLHWAEESMLVLAVDMPKMNEACLNTLLSLAKKETGVAPQHQGHWEPLAAIYPFSALASGENRARLGDVALHKWIRLLTEKQKMVSWDIPSAFTECFLNVNTAQDWQSLTK